MTTEDAAILLATYQLTGSVSETARQLGIAKSTASVHLKRAGVQPVPAFANKKEKTDYLKAWADSEGMTLKLIAEKAPEARFRDLSIYAGIAADKRYREQHPEFQGQGRGINVGSITGPVQFVLKEETLDTI